MKLDVREPRDLRRLMKALAFAAKAHRNHRRKGTSQEPYINHLIEVADLVAAVESSDMDVLMAALLHDVLEDTQTVYAELVTAFVERVAKSERNRARLEEIGKKSREARLAHLESALLQNRLRRAGRTSADLDT